MAKYKIKGNLKVFMVGSRIEFSLFPDSTYLAPDKEKAIFLSTSDNTAKLIALVDDEIKFETITLADSALASPLLQLALDNKKVEIYAAFNEGASAGNKETAITINGFIYPVK